MLTSFGVLCGGDFSGVVAAREMPVAVREVDRRVLLVDVGTEVRLPLVQPSHDRRPFDHLGWPCGTTSTPTQAWVSVS